MRLGTAMGGQVNMREQDRPVMKRTEQRSNIEGVRDVNESELNGIRYVWKARRRGDGLTHAGLCKLYGLTLKEVREILRTPWKSNELTAFNISRTPRPPREG